MDQHPPTLESSGLHSSFVGSASVSVYIPPVTQFPSAFTFWSLSSGRSAWSVARTRAGACDLRLLSFSVEVLWTQSERLSFKTRPPWSCAVSGTGL